MADFVFRWRFPRLAIVRSADLHGIVLNRLCGVLIGVGFPLLKLSRRPGYPQLSLLWGRSVMRRSEPRSPTRTLTPPTGAEYFGEHWNVPALDGATWVPTPAGQSCGICGETVVSGERGWIRGAVRTVDGVLTAAAVVHHAECEVLTTVGHIVGVCSCTGYQQNREAALLAWDRLQRGQVVDRG